MPERRRPSSRDRLLGVGLQARVIAAAAALVVACGGFLAYRAVAAVSDAYRWTGEAEAATVARGFTHSLSSRDLRDLERLRERATRLSGVHPDLTAATVTPVGADTPRTPVYARQGAAGRLVYPIIDGRGRALAVLELQFALDERAEAFAAGRREILLAGVGAALLLIIGVGAVSRRLLVRPVEQLAENAMGLAAGRPAEPLGLRRRDAIGTLAGSLDALGGTMQALQARIRRPRAQGPAHRHAQPPRAPRRAPRGARHLADA